MANGMAQVCAQGHVFSKSSSCKSCPKCEKKRKPTEGFLAQLSAPARRACEQRNVLVAGDLCVFSEQEVLSWHGVGPGTLPKLREALRTEGLSFRQKL